MNKHSLWRETRLADILTYRDDLIEFDDMAEYLTITVKRRHGGLEQRERLFGHEIKTKKQFRLHPGVFIISRVQCWHQAYAIVPDDIPPNMIASQNYDQFTVSPEIDKRFFWWLSHSPEFTETVRSSASGVVIEKMVFSREDWLEKTVLVPPLDEQRRIVERIEALAAKIADAKLVRDAGIEEIDAFWKSLLSKTFSPNKSIQYTVEESCEAIIDNLHATPRYDGNEFLCVRSQDIGWGTMNYSTMLKTSEEEFLERIRRGEPRKDDIVFVREGDIGRCAVLDGAHRLSLGQRVMMLRPDRTKIIPNFLMYQLMSSPVLVDQLLSGKKGTTSHHLNISHFRKVKINVPPLDEQRRIVAYLDSVQARLASLRELQSATGEELSALLPSVLDRAFKGEL